MTIFQVLILLFSLVIIYKAILKLIRKEISTLLFSLWTIVWLGVIVIDFFPYSIAHIANLVGIGRGVDLIIYLAIIAIFFFLFKINERQSKIDKKISKIVRQSAKNSIK